MYKVAAVGRNADVLGFLALGFRVVDVQDTAGAADALRQLARSGEYAAIFITEDFAEELADEIARYADSPLPAIVPIPSAGADTGYGMKAITDAVERAVGADVL